MKYLALALLFVPSLALSEDDAYVNLMRRLESSQAQAARQVGQNHGNFRTYEDLSGNTIVRPTLGGNTTIISPSGAAATVDAFGNSYPAAPVYAPAPANGYGAPSWQVYAPRR
jgi:hypothetical protein